MLPDSLINKGMSTQNIFSSERRSEARDDSSPQAGRGKISKES